MEKNLPLSLHINAFSTNTLQQLSTLIFLITMFSKTVCLFALVAFVSAGQIRWPAGVSPAACPNYPNCDPRIDPIQGVPRSPQLPGIPANRYPAGVSAAACPDYPYCTQRSAVPYGYVNTAGYPAGVSAATCPNFPYC